MERHGDFAPPYTPLLPLATWPFLQTSDRSDSLNAQRRRRRGDEIGGVFFLFFDDDCRKLCPAKPGRVGFCVAEWHHRPARSFLLSLLVPKPGDTEFRAQLPGQSVSTKPSWNGLSEDRSKKPKTAQRQKSTAPSTICAAV